jgi:hypothetical protein
MKPLFSSLTAVVIFAVMALPVNLLARTRARIVKAAPESLEKRFERVLPNEQEEVWRAVGWRTNLMEARAIAQEQKRPVFLWIIVGNPHGCT